MVAEELKLIVKAEVDDAVGKLRQFQGATKEATESGMSLSEAFFKFSVGINQSLEILNKIGQAMKAVMDAAEAAATITQLNAAFRSMTDKAGISADDLLDSLRAASQGTIATVDLMKGASRANLFGLPMDRLADLMKIARASSMATGQSMTYMFDSIVTGIGRASPLILDNLGIVLSIEEATERYAEAVGKKAKNLTDAEKAQALFNEVLSKGQAIIDKVGASVKTDAEKFAQLKAATSEVRTEIAKDTIPVMSSLAGAGAELAEQFVETKQRSDAVDAAIKAVGEDAKKSGQEIGLFAQFVLKAAGALMKMAPLQGQAAPAPKIEMRSFKTEELQSLKQRIQAVTEASGEMNLSFQVQAETVGKEYTSAMQNATKASRELVDVSELVASSLGDAFGAMGAMLIDAEEGWAGLGRAITGMIANTLEALGQQALVQAMVKVGLASLNPLQSFAAAAAAFAAAGFVRALGEQKMAEGGIVTGPTHALIGEAGPEAVIPLNKAGGFGTTIIVHGNVMRERDMYRAADKWRRRAYAGY